MPDQHVPPEDPLGLDEADRRIRINDLEEKVRDLGMGSSRVSDECPPDAHEEFLRNIVDYEAAPIGSHFDRLVKAGVGLPAPASLDDAALHAKLWEVIRALAKLDTFLHHTDHLGDRQLYQHLWTDSLREEGPMMSPGSGWNCHIDVLGACTEEDIEICLRYYDSEEDRQRWAKDFPDMVIPPHEDPPYDRDRHLPPPTNDLPQMGESGESDDGFDEEGRES